MSRVRIGRWVLLVLLVVILTASFAYPQPAKTSGTTTKSATTVVQPSPAVEEGEKLESKLAIVITVILAVVWEAFPFVVLGALVAGILEEFVPQQWITRIMPKNKLLGIGMGCLLGLLFPMCECGIVPVMRRLLRKGVPLGTCVAYMLAGPIINPIVIISTWMAFKNYETEGRAIIFLRIGLGFVVAFLTAIAVQVQFAKRGYSLLRPLAIPPSEKPTPDEKEQGQVHPAEYRAGESRPLGRRIANVAETSLHDFIDIMVFLALGSCLAGIARAWLVPNDAQMASLSTNYPAAAILVMMFTAIIMCLCSEADAFVAASFTKLHMSAKVAFLVIGPMFDLKLLLMFTRVFRKRVIITIFLGVSIQVFVYSLITYFVWEAFNRS